MNSVCAVCMWVDAGSAETLPGCLICHRAFWFAVAAALLMLLVFERRDVSFFWTSVASGQFVFVQAVICLFLLLLNLPLPPHSLQERSKLEVYSTQWSVLVVHSVFLTSLLSRCGQESQIHWQTVLVSVKRTCNLALTLKPCDFSQTRAME